ncbi:MAG: hypothetical protein HY720_14060 [Planctomycetes bacterium]|nr:hypothetical protein [Planctomycetota bacterium]
MGRIGRLLAVVALVAWPLAAAADDSSANGSGNGDQKSARDALKDAYKSLVSSGGYNLSFSLVVGTSLDGGKTISAVDTRQAYQGPVFRQILGLETEGVYITRKGGACFDSTARRWAKVNQVTKGRLIAGILQLPEEHMEAALRHAANARWEGNKVVIPVPGAVVNSTFNSIQNSGCAGGT